MNYTNSNQFHKNVGIVTWYRRGHNFGSSLQAYAIQSYLKRNYSIEFINYEQENIDFYGKIKLLIKSIIFHITNKRILSSWRKYDDWIKENIMSSKQIKSYNYLKKYSRKYDALVCGSDQIWNNDLKCNPFYFLRFVEKNKRIAYAPSIGRNYIDDNLKSKYKEYISDFDFVSVRDENSRNLIKGELDLDVEVCLDPSFLLTKEEWNEIAIANDKTDYNNFIFVYLLKPKAEYFDSIKKYAYSVNKEVVVAITTPYYKYDDSAIIVDQFDFLNYIRKSDLVITDSFHGMVFSLLFNKNFRLYKRFNDDDMKSQNSRLDDLLLKLCIPKDIYISSEQDFNFDIDYSLINKMINDDVLKSRNFLDNALEKVTKENL